MPQLARTMSLVIKMPPKTPQKSKSAAMYIHRKVLPGDDDDSSSSGNNDSLDIADRYNNLHNSSLHLKNMQWY